MAKELCIKLIALENGIVFMGLRRISALVKTKYPKTTTYIYDLGALSTGSFLRNWMFSSLPKKGMSCINKKLIEELAAADVLGLSCVSLDANEAKEIITLVKEKNPKIIVIWGGVHATIFPEDSINYADAVCIGEGEKSIMALLEKIEKKEDFSSANGFWIRQGKQVKKNEIMPLMSGEELGAMPFQDYGFDIKYVTHNSLKPMTEGIYISRLGSTYNMVWSMGCPHKCSYCANNKFLLNSKEYGKLRYRKAESVIDEVLDVKKNHDYVTHVTFSDDNLPMIRKEDLRLFADLWRTKVGLPFFVVGFHPLNVDREKVEILVEAGMKKARMGIQSGSERTRAFYKRNTSREKIVTSANILASFYPKINPPNYDIIVDNPTETKEDKEATLSLLREIKRPYMLFIFSLRVMPGTALWDFAQESPQYDFKHYSLNYQFVYDYWMGNMVFLLGIYNPSDYMYKFWNRLASTKYINRILFFFLRIAYLFKRLYWELRADNFEFIANVSPSLARLSLKMRSFFAKSRGISGTNPRVHIPK